MPVGIEDSSRTEAQRFDEADELTKKKSTFRSWDRRAEYPVVPVGVVAALREEFREAARYAPLGVAGVGAKTQAADHLQH
jgi:hypothetical protein